MSTVLTAGIRLTADTKGVKGALNEVATDLKQVGDAGQQAAAGSREFASAQAQATGMTRAFAQASEQTQQQLNQVGLSAKQTAFAMRQLPMQMTDVFTGLASGQSPMMVLIQQGGQLKDTFGGVGAAARAVGGYLVGLINPYTVLAAAIGAVAAAAYQGSQEVDEYNRSIIMSGNASGVTAGQLQLMAQSLSVGKATQGAAAEVLAALVEAGTVGKDVLLDATAATLEWSRATGQKVGDVAKSFSDLAKDPLAATLKLNEGLNYLTESTYANIKSLVDQGRHTDAVKEAQRAYFDMMQQRAPQMLENLGFIERAWQAVSGSVAGAWDAMKGIGRQLTPEAELARLEERVKNFDKYKQQYQSTQLADQALQADMNRIAALKSQVAVLGQAAQAEADRAAKVKARAEADKDALKYLSDQQKMQRDIAQQTDTLRRAGAGQAEIEERIAKIKSGYSKKGGAAAVESQSEAAGLRAQIKEAERYLQQLQELDGQAKKSVAADQTAAKLREELAGKLSDSARAAKQAALAEAERLAPIQRAIELEQERIKWQEQAREETVRAAEAAYNRRVQVEEERDRQLESNQTIGMSAVQLAEHKRALDLDRAAMIERRAELIASMGGQDAMAASLRGEAQALRELADARVDGAQKQVAVDEAKRTAEEWRRTADDINRSLTDALMRAFESGKGFGESLVDSLKNMLKAQFAKSMLEPMVSAFTSMFRGGAGGAQSSGGTGSWTSILGSAGQYFQTGYMNTISGTGAAAGMQAGAQMGGVDGTAMSLGAASPYIAAAYAVYSWADARRQKKKAERAAIAQERVGLQNQIYEIQAAHGNTEARDTLRRGEAEKLNVANRALYWRVKQLEDETRVLDERKQLEGRLLQLQGNTAELRRREREQLDESNRALYDQIAALQDKQAADEAAKHVADERLGIEQQLLQLQGNTSELRKQDLAALDKTNRALMEQVYALQDAQEAAAKAAQITQERTGLEEQLLQAQGNTAELRRRERDQLDESNRALYDQVKALEDATQAEQERKQRLDAIASERNDLEGQFLQAQGNTAELRRREREQLDESNRALYDQVKALEDQKAAAEQAQQAAEQMRQEWDRLGQSIEDEVGRIRGVMADQGGNGVAYLQSQFAVATAAARAGSQDQASRLPGLSQSLLSAFEKTASSRNELDDLRSQVLRSLQETRASIGGGSARATAAVIPALLGGYVNPAQMVGSPAGDVQLSDVRKVLADMLSRIDTLASNSTAENRSIATSLARVARILDDVTQGGTRLRTVESQA